MEKLHGQPATEREPPVRCPYCGEALQADLHTQRQIHDRAGVWEIHSGKCASCEKAVILLIAKKQDKSSPYVEIQAWPKEVSRPPLPPEVVEPYASDYYEACFVLADSPRASAALSRRCLQALLREKAGVGPGNLSGEVDQALASETLPPELASMLAGVRDVGNFADHPLKSTHPGVVVDVERGEAEYVLDVLEALFEFYLVRPAQLKEKSDALKEKAAASDTYAQARARSVRRIVTYVTVGSRD